VLMSMPATCLARGVDRHDMRATKSLSRWDSMKRARQL
jgi:hypothetical protein